MIWEWLEPPRNLGEPETLLAELGKLVGQPAEPHRSPPPRQVFFDRVRSTVAAVAPESAGRAQNGLANVRRRWKEINFLYMRGLLGTKTKETELPETRAEYRRHQRFFLDLERRFLAFDAQVLELADTILQQRASGSAMTAEDFATRTAFAAPTACGMQDERWQKVKPLCLLSQGTVVRVPVAIVHLRKGTGSIDWFECEVFRHGIGVCGPHPLQEVALGTQFETSVGRAWIEALKLAGNPPATATWRFEASKQSMTGVEGGSAGGAMALAFYRALKNQKADPRVLVVASISASGQLEKVNDLGIPAKVRAACEQGEIDTIATVAWHCPEVAGCLDDFYSASQEQRVRVVEIALPPASG